ncbi:MAG TPA: MEDS domain-containing protein, partial [Burkholderiales bacterium]|nr:MEDS domain-containing protein [Burkholderiales bacterium]
MSGEVHFADCGLPGIKLLPYGVHMCHFYNGAEDLAEALVPYFTAGLRGNERCIWITATPLPAAQAKLALAKAGLDVDAAVRKGSLVVRDYSEWYAELGSLKGNAVVELWLEEEQKALAAGYAGLRITGNVSFLTPETWQEFMDYEHTVNQTLVGRRIVSLCSYQLGRGNASDVLDVVRRHHCTLDHPDHGWQILSGRSG